LRKKTDHKIGVFPFNKWTLKDVIRHLFYIFPFFIFLIFLIPSEASAQRRVMIPGTYTLRGNITLEYERFWQDTSDLETFTHNYTLGLSGFIVDPRFLTFDIEPTFRQRITYQADNIEFYSLNSRVSLLTTRPIRGFFRNFPQPINLYFNYFDTEGFKSNNYGINFGFDPLERLRLHRTIRATKEEAFLKEQAEREKEEVIEEEVEEDEEKEEDRVIKKPPEKKKETIEDIRAIGPPKWTPLPVFYIDYDRYTYKTQDTNFVSDHLNLRALDNTKDWEYRLEYDLYKYGGNTVFKTHYMSAETKHFFFKPHDERIETTNRVLITDTTEKTTFDISNRTSWFKRLGPGLKDTLTFRGGANYFESDKRNNYNVGGTLTYNKYFSERFRDIVGVDASFGKADEDFIYSVGLLNQLSYDLSKNFSVLNSLRLSQTDVGLSFSGSLGFPIRTFINLNPSYEYSSTALEGGRSIYHKFNFDFSGRIFQRVNFNSQNYYRITDSRGLEPFKERTLSLKGDFFTTVGRFNISLGFSSIMIKKTNERSSDIGLTTINSNISSPISKRMFLTVGSYYVIAKDGDRILNIKPVFTWSYKEFLLSAEYELSKRQDTTGHRILIRATRNFSMPIRRFLF
jgi:hypothetical protein